MDDQKKCPDKVSQEELKIWLAIKENTKDIEKENALRVHATLDLERRLEGLNQLRKEVQSDREQFVKKETYEIKTSWYDEWCNDVSSRLTKIETRSVVWTTAIGIFFVIVQIAIYLLKGVR
jgi:hypothetical protein